MKDDASPLEGWDYDEYIKFAPKAANDVMGSFFFFLRDMFLRFCKRLKDIDVHFRLFNVDAQELPNYVGMKECCFDCIEVDMIPLLTIPACTYDRYIGLKHLRSRIRWT